MLQCKTGSSLTGFSGLLFNWVMFSGWAELVLIMPSFLDCRYKLEHDPRMCSQAERALRESAGAEAAARAAQVICIQTELEGAKAAAEAAEAEAAEAAQAQNNNEDAAVSLMQVRPPQAHTGCHRIAIETSGARERADLKFLDYSCTGSHLLKVGPYMTSTQSSYPLTISTPSASDLIY